jgi:hypothetical protein
LGKVIVAVARRGWCFVALAYTLMRASLMKFEYEMAGPCPLCNAGTVTLFQHIAQGRHDSLLDRQIEMKSISVRLNEMDEFISGIV